LLANVSMAIRFQHKVISDGMGKRRKMGNMEFMILNTLF